MDKLQINLKEYEGKPVVSSREIADNFEKEHKNVLRDIENLIIGGGSNLSRPLFIESKYQHPQNKQWYKEYLLTRDGFSLLVMGFTGAKALEWKLKYIEAFNKMEEYIKNQLPQLSEEDKAWLEIHHANQDANVTLIVNSTVEKATKQLNDAWGKVLIRELDGEGRTITLGTLADILNGEMDNSCLTTNITNYLVHKGYLKKVRFIKEIKDRFGNIIYKEEKNCHNQPTEIFINDFVKTGLAETKEIKPNGKILWSFTDRFITYFIDNFIEEFEKMLGQTSDEYLLEKEVQN